MPPPAASASSSPGDVEWPEQLAGLRDAGALHERGGEPVGLWIRGAHDLHQLAGNSVAVVGSRAATSYGTEQATELSRDLATMGHTIVSGLAYGVDQAAHRGALVAGGPTIAVMPCGVDRPYPAAHAQLLEAIAERGLVVSEGAPRSRAHPNPVPGQEQGRRRPVRGHHGRRGRHPQRGPQHRSVGRQPAPPPDGHSRAGHQRRLVGVNQLIRLGQASMVTNAQEVINTDLTTHAYSAAAARDQLDESFVPGPVRSLQGHVPGPIAPVAAPRR